MVLEVTAEQLTELEQAAAHARQTRTWKRYEALMLLADGESITQVSTALACGQSTIYRWVALWREQEVECLAEGPHLGRVRRLDPPAEAHLQVLLEGNPQAHGHHSTNWTVPLLLGELATVGWVVHEHTLRRTLKPLEASAVCAGRPDPANAVKGGCECRRSGHARRGR